MLIRITTDYYCCGIIADYETIVKAPPILKWTLGKDKDWLLRYLWNRGILRHWEEINIES